MTSTDSVPLLLDTDIGSDIDDAVCLAYLLRQPRAELVGVTTVSGKPCQRAALADAVCRAAGRSDVPIIAGCDTGLLGGVVQPDCPQAAILSRFEHRRPDEFPRNEAVDFLRRKILERPGELTLLGIGPMTNLGLLFATDPSLAGKLKRLVLMCGIFKTGGPGSREWNALCDPVATAAVYRAGVGDHLSVGLDVTMQCQMPCAEAMDRFNTIGGPLGVVSAMTEVWASERAKITFHDPLAAALIFRPDLCEYESGRVDIEIESKQTAGATYFRAGQGPVHRIATSVNAEAFFEHYFGVTGGS